MFEVVNREKLENFVAIGGLVVLQFIYAGNSVFLGYLLSLGFNSFSLAILNSIATFIVLSPAAFYFERTKWPKKFSLKLLILLFVISLSGTTIFQTCMMKGIALTSPAIATAMPNLAPGVIFIIAWIVRLEKIDFSCTYSRIKILGTLFCVVGALAMSLLQNTSPKQVPETEATSSAPVSQFNQQRILGCAYLMAAVLGLSINVVMQAAALVELPAPISLCAVTSLIGASLTAMLQLLRYHTIDFGLQILGVRGLIGLSVLGGTVAGVCFSFGGWALARKGPVTVSMFSPIGTVLSVILSLITLGDMISLGR
ncbi:EamA domain [Dillenia turbinata]|uniref:WAT1-related protein n=1 Tax=Dillenia turbinata TaxID=194707 RepID=A0AAN8WFT3_9MAGN